jgi:putative tryptophan/tyrosine transport system substrate-binding protein
MKTHFTFFNGIICALLLSILLYGCSMEESPSITSPNENKQDLPIIGVANYGAHPIIDVIVDAFKARLKEQGYEEGKDIEILWKSVEGDVNLSSSVAQSLLNSKVSLIMSITTPVSQAVYKAAKGKVPIVFCGVTDPISAGLVEAWENKPGSGITGSSDRWPYSEQLDLIKTILPNAKKVGFPYNSGEANSQYAIKQVVPLARERGLEIISSVATNIGEVRRAATSLAEQGVDVFYVSSDNTVMAGFEAVLKVSYERKIPVIVGESANVERGGLATYSVDYRRLGESSADLVIEVLNGKDPGSIPIVTFNGEELFLNLDAAQKMGVELDPDLVNKATKVYSDKSTAIE